MQISLVADERRWWSCQLMTCENTLTLFKIYLKGIAHILITFSQANDLYEIWNTDHIIYTGRTFFFLIFFFLIATLQICFVLGGSPQTINNYHTNQFESHVPPLYGVTVPIASLVTSTWSFQKWLETSKEPITQAIVLETWHFIYFFFFPKPRAPPCVWTRRL